MNERTTKCVIKENNMRPPLKTTDIYFWNVSPCMNICRCNALPILYLVLPFRVNSCSINAK